MLPFADLSPGRDQEYFADGVAEEILSALSRVPGLRVPGRASSFYFKKKGVEPAEIAQKLGVGYLLEGSVRRSGNRLRISAELVKAADGERLWSQAFDPELTDVFAVQDEIARAVVAALRVKLLPGKSVSVAASRPTNSETYRLYLLGKQLQSKGTPDEIEAGVRSLEEAVRLDPKYVPARAWLALARWDLANIGPSDPSRQGEAAFDLPRAAADGLREAEEVISLAPEAPEGYWLRGFLRGAGSYEWAGALADYQHALDLSPGDVRTRLGYARTLATLGRLPEALALAQEAAESDPLSTEVYRWLGVIQAASGSADLAVVTLRRGLDVAPANGYLRRELGFAYVLTGRGEEALRVSDRAPADWLRDLGRALAYRQLGREEDSRLALRRLIELHRGGVVRPTYQIAEAYAWRGENEEAFRWLEKALAEHDAGIAYLRFDPLLRSLRSDPRYTALLKRVNLPVDPGAAPTGLAQGASAPSIAVLPFADMSEKHDQEYFADGVAEEIRNALAHVEGLKVIGRSSSASFKGKSDDLGTIGQKLGVANVLEGSLRKDGGDLRVTAQLIRVADGTHLWSDSYDRKLEGTFKVQDEIAEAVVGALKLRLVPGRSAGSKAIRTGSTEAYQEYLLGRRLLTHFSEESGRRAIEAFERAVRLDPDYAPAWGGLSMALGVNAESNGTVDEAMAYRRRALEAANRAVALAPDLADGYVARANLVDIRGWDWPGAIADAARAVQLSPRDAAARTTHGMLLAEVGREQEGILELERATEFDPLSAEAWGQLGWFAVGDRKRRAFDRAREINPDNAYSTISGGTMRREQAAAIVKRKPGHDSVEYVSLIEAHLVLGQQAEAHQALDGLIACCSHNGAWQIAAAYDLLGDRDRAFEWLDRARVQMDTGVRFLRCARAYRGDPRTKAILKKMNLSAD